jgi:uncharacterized membrane protein
MGYGMNRATIMQPIVTTAEAARVATTAVAGVPSRLRLDAIDLVRGVVMILMVLDHTRDFVHAGGITGNPLDPNTTTALLYLTRWLTHLCAPTFALLAGLGVGLRRLRGATAGQVSWFLFTRGLWLVALELTLFRVIVWFNLDLSFLAFLQVIWAIGLSMIGLSALVGLPRAVLGAIAFGILAGHNLLDAVRVPFWLPGQGLPDPGLGGALWMLAHQGGFFPVGGASGPVVLVQYPLLPWLGIVTAGYVMAAIYGWTAERRQRTLVLTAMAMLAAFLVLRTFNIYGDPGDWAPQATPLQSAMSFLNVQKYPPSLAYVLVTLVPALLTLAALDGRTITGGIPGAVVIFGRVPFFFYVLQWLTAHVSGMIVTAVQGKSIDGYFQHLLDYFRQPPTFGGPLWAVYVCWIVSVLAMYPLCRWFAGVKARRREWWLSYL